MSKHVQTFIGRNSVIDVAAWRGRAIDLRLDFDWIARRDAVFVVIGVDSLV